ncbi:unnamed protein product, partial [Ixodes persulcatus]
FIFFHFNLASTAFRSGHTIHDCVQTLSWLEDLLFPLPGIDIFFLYLRFAISFMTVSSFTMNCFSRKLPTQNSFLVFFFLKAESLGWLFTAARRNIERAKHNK